MTWAIVQATEDHARWIAPRMTAEDCAEVEAAGLEPLKAILTSHRLSLWSQTWLVDDEPACMFGFATPSMLGPLAQPWMLGTNLVRRHKIAFLRNYRVQIGRMLDVFPVLETVVDARHAVCLRWLKYSGFEILETADYAGRGVPFTRVRLERSTWAQ